MPDLPLFGFGDGQSPQLLRIMRENWGTKITVDGEPQDTAVDPLAQELVTVLQSLLARDDALKGYINGELQNFMQTALTEIVNNMIINNQTEGISGSVVIPLTFAVDVSGCDVTITTATSLTLTFQNGLCVGAG